MANIFAILNGQPGFGHLSAMPLDELMDWHDRAIARAPDKD